MGHLCHHHALHLRMGKRRLDAVAHVGTRRFINSQFSFHPNSSGVRAECLQSGSRGVRLVALRNDP